MRVMLFLTLLGLMLKPYAETAVAECELARGRLLVPVQIQEGPSCLMAIDLATQHPVLDPRVAAAFAMETLETGVKTTDAAERPLESKVVSLSYAPAPGFRHVDSAVLQDLSGLSAWLGREVGGLLPAHVPGYEVTLDFARRQVLWRDIGQSSVIQAGGDTVKMAIAEDGAPVLLATIDQQQLLPLELDLFSSESLSLPAHILQSTGLAGEAPRLAVDDSTQQLVRLRQLDVASTQLRQPLCVVTQGERCALGLAFLSRFRLTLNYEAGLCRLDPAGGNRIEEPPLEGTGVLLQRIEGSYWRARVVEPSSAYRAGVRTGDLVVAIAGTGCAGVASEAIEPMLRGDREGRVALTLSRAGQLYTVEAKVEPLL